MTLNKAVLAPIPRASDKTATVVKAGVLSSIRTPYRKSWNICFSASLRFAGSNRSGGVIYVATPLEGQSFKSFFEDQAQTAIDIENVGQ
jgi:hypothetical protein